MSTYGIPDVRFDHARAEAAASACERAARQARDAASSLAANVRAATVEWNGPTRETFDRHAVEQHEAVTGYATLLLDTAAAIRSAADAARSEQRDRERRRAEIRARELAAERG